MKLKLILTTATVGVALALPSISNAAPAAAASASTSSISGPTLTLKRNCDFPPANYVNVILSGFPPFTPFGGTLEFDGAGIGPIQLTTDENGNFDSSSVGFVGSFEPVTFRATIVWAGGTLRESLFVDCSKPASKEDCKNGGWRNYPQFNNQGLCLAFVERGP